MQLRPFQHDNKDSIYKLWDQGVKNILSVLPTGGGKTVIFSEVLKDHDGPSCAVAHRQELVIQISLALAKDEVPHKIIGPPDVVRLAVNTHMDELGQSYVVPNAHCAVAGVDTLIRRQGDLSRWSKSVTKWVIDEAHHVIQGNKWGQAIEMFPNALGLGVTATPSRADGKGLGRYANGLFDQMVVGPSGRQLIEMGYLTDYKVFAPHPSLTMSNEKLGNSGDWSRAQLKTAAKRSPIVGDVVGEYLKRAKGKLGVTFATDVETATNIAKQFNLNGVPAEVVTSKTLNAERISILKRFRNRELLQLVNVDLFGEGFDLPAIEVVSMARPTESFALFCQQFGRALRIMISPILSNVWGNYTNAQRRAFIAESKKPYAIIIDHVGNITPDKHGLPDTARIWSLEGRNRKVKIKTDDDIPVKACPECTGVYERIYKACPFCGHIPIPGSRSAPEFVDGDLTELDAATLAKLRGDIQQVDMDPEEYRQQLINNNCPKIGQYAHVKRHVQRQEAQEALRASMSWWAGIQRSKNISDNESYRRFYFKYGIDVFTAQSLKTKEALELATKINMDLV